MKYQFLWNLWRAFGKEKKKKLSKIPKCQISGCDCSRLRGCFIEMCTAEDSVMNSFGFIESSLKCNNEVLKSLIRRVSERFLKCLFKRIYCLLFKVLFSAEQTRVQLGALWEML